MHQSSEQSSNAFTAFFRLRRFAVRRLRVCQVRTHARVRLSAQSGVRAYAGHAQVLWYRRARHRAPRACRLGPHRAGPARGGRRPELPDLDVFCRCALLFRFFGCALPLRCKSCLLVVCTVCGCYAGCGRRQCVPIKKRYCVGVCMRSPPACGQLSNCVGRLDVRASALKPHSVAVWVRRVMMSQADQRTSTAT